MTRGLGGHSPANITHHLRGTDFPASKQDLVEQAKQNGADEDVIDTIDHMADGEFQNMADVMKAYSGARPEAEDESGSEERSGGDESMEEDEPESGGASLPNGTSSSRPSRQQH